MADPVEEVAATLGTKVEKAVKARVIRVDPESVRQACLAVSSIPGLYHLSTITALDNGEAIELLYQFWQGKAFVEVRSEVSKSNPVVDSISSELPAATLYEAEIQDLFGVKFTGNPYAGKRLLLPDEYPADAPPPLRKEADPEKIRRLMKLE